MKKFGSLLLFVCLTITSAFCEGIVRGRITDENGEALIGATVVLKSKPTYGTIANYEGKYNLALPASAVSEVLLISFIGYETIEDTIIIKGKGIIVNDYTMTPQAKSLDDVVIVAKAKKANESYMHMIKSKSAVSLDYISSETVKRIGDSYATDAIKRITGVSTIGGFVSVRGLADRYIKTAVNGKRIPTLDPITNNIKLDIFPTSLIDNIVIVKTASPDLPGDWAGSYVSIETKDYPNELTLSMSFSFGYNPQSSFQEVVSSKRSKTDWLGYDNGFRDIYRAGYTSAYPMYYGGSRNQILPYHEFSALGLDGFIQDHGLSETTLGTDSRNNLDYYYRICLVELGLLAPGYIDNFEAVQDAARQYDETYKNQAFKLANTPVSTLGQKMPENWGTVSRRAPLNFSQEFSVGNQLKLFNRPLGFLFGMRYGSSLKYDPEARANGAQGTIGEVGSYLQESKWFNSSVQSNNWNALFNLAYSYSPNHSLSFMFMPNVGGVNYVREGRAMNYQAPVGNDSTYNISQFYEERKQLIYQVHSINFFPKWNIKLDISGSYTSGESGIPDSKSLTLYPVGDQYEYRSSDYVYKKSTYLFEDVYDVNFFVEKPISNKPGLVRKLKTGGSYQYNIRESEIYRFYLYGYQLDEPFSISEVNDVFSSDNFSLENNSYFYYDYEHSALNFVIGNSTIASGFMLVDYAFSPAVRISGGLRLEYTDIHTDVKLFDELNLPANHPDRKAATVGGGFKLPTAKPGSLRSYDYLPCVNIVWRLVNSNKVDITSRFNYSHSIARPSIREITPLYQEDFILQKSILGNPKLKIVGIDNFDLRFESFFAKGDNISVSFFYKNFTNHIEMVAAPYTTWKNADIAEAYGIEIEGQKLITKNFDVKANITFIESFAKIEVEHNVLKHPMFGQAPYIINAILGYTSDKKGISAAVSYNVQGRKLALINTPSKEIDVSDIYEMPQHMLDFRFNKSLGKHIGASFRIRNILNSPVRRSYDFSSVGLIDYDRYQYGTDYVIGISYNL